MESNAVIIDWVNVPVDAKIIVWDENTKEYAHFAKYENGIIHSWHDGKTSFTTDEMCEWEYGKVFFELKPTDDEKAILRNFPEWANWIVMDSYGCGLLVLHEEKPIKNRSVWCSNERGMHIYLFENCFKFIESSHEEPFNICDLLQS